MTRQTDTQTIREALAGLSARVTDTETGATVTTQDARTASYAYQALTDAGYRVSATPIDGVMAVEA